jgi:hypothetical protein
LVGLGAGKASGDEAETIFAVLLVANDTRTHRVPEENNGSPCGEKRKQRDRFLTDLGDPIMKGK